MAARSQQERGSGLYCVGEPTQFAHCGRSFLGHVRENVAVGAQAHSDFAVSETFGNDSGMLAVMALFLKYLDDIEGETSGIESET